MKVDLTDISPVKKKLSIEVDPQEVAKEMDRAVRGYAKKARISGFRPGKAPLSMIRAKFGKEIREDVRERVMARYYREATEQRQLHPLADPVLDEVHDEEGQPFTFETTFEVLPEIELASYKGVKVRRQSEELPDEEVDKALEELRQARAHLVTEEGRAAATGDVVVADVEGQPAEGEPFRRERMMFEVGAAANLPAFNEHLEGARSGGELEFSVDYPKEYEGKELAGRNVVYRMKVHEVKRREVPELDDEFAKDLGEFEDLAALRTKVREDLAQRKKLEVDRALRQAVLDKILLANPVVLPDILVEHEVRGRLDEIVRGMMMQGMDPEKVELDWKELRDRQLEPARKMVHARLIMDAVAKAEAVKVDDEEIDERIRRDAAAMGEKLETVRAKLRQRSSMEALRNQLVREKSLDLLMAVANIQNEE